MATTATALRKEDVWSIPARTETVAGTGSYELRSLPNEDVFFFAKKIDNSRIVREPDPVATSRCWSAIGAACVMAGLVISLLLPGLGNILAGYEIEDLKQQNAVLEAKRAQLTVEIAEKVRPDHLWEMAKGKYQSPTSQQVVHVTPHDDSVLAQNTTSKSR